MPTINIELTSQQYDALCKGESITINPGKTNPRNGNQKYVSDMVAPVKTVITIRRP